MNRKSVRAIVINDSNQLLVINRDKFGNKYTTLPGGLVAFNEQPEQAILRELSEETSITVQNPRLVFIDHADFYGDQLVYYCDYIDGEPALRHDTQEHAISQMGQNLYTPAWLNLSDLPDARFLSPELQRAIINATTNGWPDTVLEFDSKRNI